MIEVDPLLAPRNIIVLLALGGCGKVVDKTIPSGVKGSIEAGFLVEEISPSALKAGETLTLRGVGLDTVRISISGGDVEILSREADRVVRVKVPEGRPGVQRVDVARDGEITSFLFLRLADGDVALVAGHMENVCQGEAYYDLDGNRWEGTRDCSTASMPEPCTEDGQVGCVTTETFKAASTVDLEAKVVQGATVAGIAGTVLPAPAACESDGQVDCVANESFRAVDMSSFTDADIREGVTIAGISGVLTGAPDACTNDGQIGCLTNATYRAALTTGLANKVLSSMTVAGIPGNVTLPGQGRVLAGTVYGVEGTSLTGSLTLPNEANVLAGTPSYGDPGALKTPALANRGTWNLSEDFPGAGYYSSVTGIPAAGDIRSGVKLIGVLGTVTPSPGSCTGEDQSDCVATTTFKTVDTTTVASRVIDTATVAGVQGTVKIPLARYVLSGISFGENGADTGTLTLPDPSNVLAGTPKYGDPSDQKDPSLPNWGSWDLSSAFPGGGYYSGVINVPATGDLRLGVNLIGVTGTLTPSPGSCVNDGDTGCVVDAPYRAALTTGLADKVLSGTTVAGMEGNVTLPGPGRVLAGTAYGVGGTSLTGSLTLPDPADVLSVADNYGDPANPKVPSLPYMGQWDLRFGFYGPGYYEGAINAPDPWDIRYGTSIVGATGKLKVRCRNMADVSKFDYMNFPGQVGLDPFDTLDDFAVGESAVPIENPWNSGEHLCGYDSISNQEEQAWKDVTVSSESPVYLDRISGLRWTYGGSGKDWYEAIEECEGLVRNGADKWRLPTQKELFDAYSHGISDVDDLGPFAGKYYWSSTTSSTDVTFARRVRLYIGFADGKEKSDYQNQDFLCVHD